jgi:acetyltransferase-like isoleucine patch superfamily enzyme
MWLGHISGSNQVKEWETHSGLSEVEFTRITRYLQADNPLDNNHRARIMGFMAEGLQMAPGVTIRQPEKVQIGPNCFIGLFVYLNGDVTIGTGVLIGPHCSLSASNHVFNESTLSFSKSRPGKIVVEDGAWLSASCIVTAGVTVGRGSLLCANATVTRDVPAFAIVAGTPAEQVGEINSETGEYVWFDRKRDVERE